MDSKHRVYENIKDVEIRNKISDENAYGSIRK